MADFVRNVSWRRTCVLGSGSDIVWQLWTALTSFTSSVHQLWHLMLKGSIGLRQAATANISRSLYPSSHLSAFPAFQLLVSSLILIYELYSRSRHHMGRRGMEREREEERKKALDLRADFVLESGGRLREIFHSLTETWENSLRGFANNKNRQSMVGHTNIVPTNNSIISRGLLKTSMSGRIVSAKSKLTGDQINILMLSSKCKNSSNQTLKCMQILYEACQSTFLNQYFYLILHWKTSKYP